MTELTPFMMNVYPMPVLQARAQIINDLAQYVSFNWRDPYNNTLDPRAEVFRQSVQGCIARHFFEFHDMTDVARKRMQQPGDTYELVLSAYDKAIQLDNSEFITVPHFRDPKLVKFFTEYFSKLSYPLQPIKANEQEEPSVLGAYNMACKNFSQNQTRILTFGVLQQLLQINWHPSHNKLAEGDALVAKLYHDLSTTMRDMLLFSGLLGGDTHTHAIKLVARHMCHKENHASAEYSIMQFITVDRCLPGRYLAKTNDSLKDDIRQKYEAL
ncbi:MAG: hypothetical protein DDT31_00313 [Syntrophomonadaceae bacterium]|nr:hypothetical protein [Bacillota bacterium]